MQLSVEFSVKDLCLPIAYRHCIQGLIYDVLRTDPAFSTALHDGVTDISGKQLKLFTFGQLEGKYTIENKTIRFSDAVRLEIRSVNTQLMLLLLNGFYEGRELRLGTHWVRVVKCSLEKRQIMQNEIVVQTCSPVVSYLTLADGHTRFFTPDEEMFYRLLCVNAQCKWESLHKDDFPATLSVSPATKFFKKQVTLFKDTRITAWGGRFCLKGAPELLTLLYDTGLGAKSSQGFGMFEPIFTEVL